MHSMTCRTIKKQLGTGLSLGADTCSYHLTLRGAGGANPCWEPALRCHCAVQKDRPELVQSMRAVWCGLAAVWVWGWLPLSDARPLTG